jgi:hypothetical protein
VVFVGGVGGARSSPTGSWSEGRQESVTLPLHDAVALTTESLELGAIQDRDAPPTITDRPELLELSGCIRNSFAPHLQHVGNELVRHQDLVRRESVERKQQQSAQLLIDAVMAIAYRCLRHCVSSDCV